MIEGRKLREFRAASSVRPAEVASVAGWPRQRVAQIEQSQTISKEVAERFVNAVEAIRANREGRRARAYTLEVRLYVDGGGPYGGSVDNELMSTETNPW